MANPMIKFLRGTQANFEAKSGSYSDGVFYLTTDTNRLYVGKDANTAELLNSAINVYDSVAQLPATPPYGEKDNDTFAYCVEENILAIYRYDDTGESGHWIQINSDTQNKSVANSVKADKDANQNVISATITTTVTDRQALSDSFTIAEGSNVELDVSGKTITINALDEKTTKAGHYVPVADTTATSTDKTISGTGFVTGVKVDEKGHIVGVDTSEQTTNNVTKVALEATQGSTNTAILTSTVTDTVGSQSDTTTVVGSGATSISVANDTITISSTDEHVSNVDNHYKATTGTDSNVADKQFAIGVKKDAAGHVISVNGAASSEATDVSIAATTGKTNSVTMTVNAKNIFGENKSDTQEIIGGGATTVSVDGTVLKISSTDYQATEAGHYTPTQEDITKKQTAANGSATAAKATTQVITGIKLDSKNHVVGIESAGIQDTHNTIKSVDLTASNGNLSTNVTMNDGDAQSDTIKLTINYGEKDAQNKHSAAATLQSDGTAEAGKWDLDVYTAAQVDAKIANAVGANGAVQIVGTVDATNDLPATTAVKAGDTYIVVAANENGFGPDEQMATSGDMFIASQDDATSEGFEWYYIPAGNEVIRMAASNDNGFQFIEGNSNVTIGTVNFAKYDAASQEFQVVAEVETTETTSNVSFNMYWGSF